MKIASLPILTLLLLSTACGSSEVNMANEVQLDLLGIWSREWKTSDNGLENYARYRFENEGGVLYDSYPADNKQGAYEVKLENNDPILHVEWIISWQNGEWTAIDSPLVETYSIQISPEELILNGDRYQKEDPQTGN